jgi:hypothetical protein
MVKNETVDDFARVFGLGNWERAPSRDTLGHVWGTSVVRVTISERQLRNKRLGLIRFDGQVDCVDYAA